MVSRVIAACCTGADALLRVLLDEMNLASQTVLEGLNSCLDHRGSVYVPELGRSFSKHRDFRIFAAQNPQQQGGGRKGLPKSFLNRFTKVFVEELRAADIEIICAHLYPAFDRQALGRMIEFNARLHHATMVQHSFGRAGAPWEFNLRDLLRWLGLLHSSLGLNWRRAPMEHLANLYLQRFRSERDRAAAAAVFEAVFGHAPATAARPQPSITPGHVQFGHAVLQRLRQPLADSRRLLLLPEHLAALETLADCVQMNWLAILAGPGGAGKTSAVRLLAKLVGAHLEEFSMSSGVDTMDLLGTFEQADPQGVARRCLSQLHASLQAVVPAAWACPPEHFDCVTAALAEVQSALAALAAAKDSVLDAETLLSACTRVDAAGLLDAAGVAAAAELAEVLSATSQAPGRFEWRDGPLVRAMHSGSWLLIDDANLCSASVLDRLNSLFEPDGTIVLSERGVVDGAVPVIRPHPSFRVFMALDPRQGELSRAMRNRGIEIYLDAAAGSAFELASATVSQARTDDAQVSRELVVDDSVVAAALLQSAPCALAAESLETEAALVQVSAGLPRSSLALATRVTAGLQEDFASALAGVREHPLMLTVERSKALLAQRLLCSGAFLDEQVSQIRCFPVTDTDSLCAASGSGPSPECGRLRRQQRAGRHRPASGAARAGGTPPRRAQPDRSCSRGTHWRRPERARHLCADHGRPHPRARGGARGPGRRALPAGRRHCAGDSRPDRRREPRSAIAGAPRHAARPVALPRALGRDKHALRLLVDAGGRAGHLAAAAAPRGGWSQARRVCRGRRAGPRRRRGAQVWLCDAADLDHVPASRAGRSRGRPLSPGRAAPRERTSFCAVIWCAPRSFGVERG
jgi:MoxR-like ATPase